MFTQRYLCNYSDMVRYELIHQIIHWKEFSGFFIFFSVRLVGELAHQYETIPYWHRCQLHIMAKKSPFVRLLDGTGCLLRLFLSTCLFTPACRGRLLRSKGGPCSPFLHLPRAHAPWKLSLPPKDMGRGDWGRQGGRDRGRLYIL